MANEASAPEPPDPDYSSEESAEESTKNKRAKKPIPKTHWAIEILRAVGPAIATGVPLLIWWHSESKDLHQEVATLHTELAALKGASGEAPNIVSIAGRVAELEKGRADAAAQLGAYNDRINALEGWRRALGAWLEGKTPMSLPRTKDGGLQTLERPRDQPAIVEEPPPR